LRRSVVQEQGRNLGKAFMTQIEALRYRSMQGTLVSFMGVERSAEPDKKYKLRYDYCY
jgi:hypothetical protein